MLVVNHIHRRQDEAWVCARSIWFGDEEIFSCEVLEEQEQEACSACAEQVLAHFGDPLYVQ